jgi:shikimate dehydrogenase
MTISGGTRVAGVMGWPIDHSLSPQLHGYWLKSYRIDGAYVPLAVPPERLEQALRALPALGFAGVNLTAPHKEAAMAIVDHCDDAAQRIGAINTVIVRSDGTIEGRNTDAYGFIQSVHEGAPSWEAPSGPAVVIGAGGAARAICVALQVAGVPEIRIVNRTEKRADCLVKEFGPPLVSIPWEDRASVIGDASLLVNATTLGMQGQPSLDLELDWLPQSTVVTDIVYAPLQTPLLRNALSQNNCVVDGLGMLLHQARPGFAAWFDWEPEVTSALRTHVLTQIDMSPG